MLEQQAFELAAKFTESNFEYCGTGNDPATTWTEWKDDQRASLAVTRNGRMKVTPLSLSEAKYSCFFHFQSEQEMSEKTDAAVIVSLHLRPAN